MAQPKPILRLNKKLKSIAMIRNKDRYLNRVPVGTPDHLNPIVIKVSEVEGAYEEFKIRLRDTHKPRSNAVLGVEFILTASPSYFRPTNPRQRGQYEQIRVVKFVESVFQWSKQEFANNLVSMTLHLHQSTPHVHALVIPILDRKLNCRALYSSRDRLTELQLSYAKALKPLGIERGQPEKDAKHRNPIQWVAEIERISAREKRRIDNREKELTMLIDDVKTRQIEFEKMIRELQILKIDIPDKFTNPMIELP